MDTCLNAPLEIVDVVCGACLYELRGFALCMLEKEIMIDE